MQLTTSQQTLVSEAYETATARIAALEACNGIRRSEIRQFEIDLFVAHQQQIEQLGFFDRDDLSPSEQEALLSAADEIRLLEGDIESAHEMTLIELEADLAWAIQSIGTDAYAGALRLRWMSGVRGRRLPSAAQIPSEVSDHYAVNLFHILQHKLNKIAEEAAAISAIYRCLNSDDYSRLVLIGQIFSSTSAAAEIAVGEYLQLQALRKAERAAASGESVGVGGVLWSVIGWDSPSDFLKDVVLTVVTGGAGKVVRWAGKLDKARGRVKRARKAVKVLEDVKKQIERIEERAKAIQATAAKLRRIDEFNKLPQAVTAAIGKLAKYEEQLKLIEEAGKHFSEGYIRAVATSVAVSAPGINPRRSIGQVASNEAARMAIDQFLAARFAKRLDALGTELGFTTLLVRGMSARKQMLLMEYVFLHVVREYLGRLILAVVHKEKLDAELLVTQFSPAVGAAVQRVLLQMQFVPKAVATRAGQYVVDTFRKLLVEVANRMAKALLERMKTPLFP